MNLRRAFLAITGIPCRNRHCCKVDLVVLYTVLPSFPRIHARFTVRSSSVATPALCAIVDWIHLCRIGTHCGPTLPHPAPLLVSEQDGCRRPVPCGCGRACLLPCSGPSGPCPGAAPPAGQQAPWPRPSLTPPSASNSSHLCPSLFCKFCW